MLALLLAPASLVPTGRPAVTTSSRRAALADFGAAAAALAVVPLAAHAKSLEEIAAEANVRLPASTHALCRRLICSH